MGDEAVGLHVLGVLRGPGPVGRHAEAALDGGLDLGVVQGVSDQGLDIDVGEGLLSDCAGVAADLGGEAADLGGVFGPERADAGLALIFRKAFIVTDGLGAFPEGLHPGLEGFGGRLDGALRRGLGIARESGRQGQDGKGGGEAEDADHGDGSLSSETKVGSMPPGLK